MRPIRLELRGFTAFRDETVIDFSGRSLFAITGPTGAGKSSLLDAMTWALYGRVPRVGTAFNQLMSHGAQAMAVSLEFSVRGATYRVARQAGKASAMRLERLVGERWEMVADRAREAADGVERVLGLDYATFTKTVLLPQGAFDAFLRGDPGERRDILSGLLGLGVYEQMRSNAGARAAGARSAAEAQRQQIAHFAFATPEAIAALELERTTHETTAREVSARRAVLAALIAAEREASERTREAEVAERAALAAATTHEQALQAATAAADALATADADLVRIAKERETLAYDAEAHRVLEQQATQLVQREQAAADLARAREAHEAALAAAQRATNEAEAAAEAATAARTAATEAADASQQARAELAAVAGPARATASALRERLEGAERDRVEAEQRASEYEERSRVLIALAKALLDHRAEHETADSAVQQATAAAASAEAEQQRAAKAESAAAKALALAVTKREAAQQQHTAAALRRGLKVGDPCPVCGEPITSLAGHEAPDLDAADEAVAQGERILAEARAAHTTRMQAAASAHAQADSARANLATVEARSTALDARCTEIGVARSGIDRAAKRATTAAAAERERAVAAAQAATELAPVERALAMLLATLPADLDAPTAKKAAKALEGDELAALPERVQSAITCASTAASAAQARDTEARGLEETARGAAAAAEHAGALAQQAAQAATEAQARLEALGGGGSEDAEALLAALTEAQQRAERAQALDAAKGRAEQAHAAADSVRGEREAAVARAAEVATRAVDASNAAHAAAGLAAQAYEERWRPLELPEAPNGEQLVAKASELSARELDARQQLGVTSEKLEASRREVEEARRLEAEAAVNERVSDIAKALSLDLQKGAGHFVAFVQREAMHVLAAEASDRMDHLSRGRYRLKTDGDEFVVIDRQNGDEQRSVKTLSGGETFLASLALALALAERLPQLAGHGGAIALESLFLDEGFGTLDADALDVAIEALELLASGDRMIGVISHVPLIAERLPDRIEVTKGAGTSSVQA